MADGGMRRRRKRSPLLRSHRRTAGRLVAMDGEDRMMVMGGKGRMMAMGGKDRMMTMGGKDRMMTMGGKDRMTSSLPQRQNPTRARSSIRFD